LDFPLGQNIDADDWECRHRAARCHHHRMPMSINRTIDEWQSVVNEIIARYELLEKRIPTPGENQGFVQ
jgi:hypothetical protein